MWYSIKPVRRQLVAIASAVAVAAAASASADTTSTWNGSASTLWSNALNWTPNAFAPNNGNGGVNYAVVIGTPSPTVLDINATIDALTINSGGNLQTNGGTTLTVNGPTITDNGTITINFNNANAGTFLQIAANTTLSGTGTLSLNDNGNVNVAQLNTSANVTLTQAAGHSITGHGAFNAALVNNGTVNANSVAGSAALVLQTSNMINNNLFEGTSNGTLEISGITVTQGASGQLLASGGVIDLISGTVSKGTLNTASGGVIQALGASVIDTLINNATLNIIGGATLSATGDIADNGTITVNSNNANTGTILSFNGGNLTGNGTIALNDNGNVNVAQLNGSLTQGANHTISGHGAINANLTNNGTVNANSAAGSAGLILQTSNMTNNKLFEATNGGTLTFSGITVNQGAAGLILAANGTVSVSGSAIANGTLNTTGTGVIQLSGASSITFLTSNGTLNIAAGASVTANGNIVDNGNITINPTQTNAGTILNFTGGTLSGTGTLTLNDNNNSVVAQLNGILTQAAGHTTVGRGQINATLTNNGVVNANANNTTLFIQGPSVTNNNLLEATNGATLNFSSTTVNNAGGNISAVSGGVTISSSTINGGNLNSSGGNALTLSTATLNAVTTTAGAIVNISPGTTTTLTGATLTNNGNITVNTTETAAGTSLNAASNLSLAGTGSIFLNDNGNPVVAQLNTSANITLTQNAGHTIIGHGEINASLVNNGTVNASAGILILQSNNMTNNNLFEATNGTLNISGITVTQGAAGQISANPGTVNVASSTISHGTLAASGAGVFQITATSTIDSLTNNAPINIFPGLTLNATGNITNNNVITVNSTQTNAGTALTFAGGTLSGTGSVVLNDNGNPVVAQLNGTLTNGANQTITGHGEINAALTNNGTVIAAGGTLILQSSNMTNNNLFEATTGTLSISGITVTQGAAGQISANPGTVNLAAATISHGTLAASGAGVFQITGTSTIDSLTNNAPININFGTILNVTGNITNNNVITVNSTAANAGTSFTFSGGTLSGTGTVLLNDNGNPVVAQLNGTLTTGASQTITGHGNINATLTNNGTILSNITSTAINVNGVINNNNLIRVTNGGAINFAAGTVTSNGTLTGSGTFRIDANSSMSVPANTLFTNASTIILTGPNAVFSGLSSLTTNSGNLTITNGATVTLSGSYTQTANGTLAGNGTLIATALFGNLSTVVGTVQVVPNGTNPGTSKLTTLAIAGASNAWTGNLNITNNKLIVEATPATKATILNTLRDQVNFGKTHAAGITLSSVPAHTGTAVVDNAALATPFTTFGGQTVDADSLIVAPELLGDADLSGKVDLTDLSTVLNNFGVTTPDWTAGNFAGDPAIDLTDLSDVLNNFGLSNLNASASAAADLTAPSPEPASLAALTTGAIAVLFRRRRCTARCS